MIGGIGVSSNNYGTLPTSAILLKKPCWIITNDYLNINGVKTPSTVYAEAMEKIQVGQVVTMTLTHSGTLGITIGSTVLDDLLTGLPHHVYPVFDLYGICEKISIINSDLRNGTPISEELPMTTNNLTETDSVPHCEKADLEVHEKETELPQPGTSM